MTREMVKLDDIARAANVTKTTVSRALNDRAAKIPEQTRRRIKDIADRMGYRPNLLVRGVQTGKTNTIGVMVPPFDSFWSEVLCGIHDQLVELDHVPLTLWISHDIKLRNPDVELQQVYRMLDRRVDGAILWPTFASLYADHVAEFSDRHLPVVTIDHQLPAETGADYVGTDEAMGGRIAAEHLLSLGHRRIAHLASASGASWADERRRSFEEAIKSCHAAQCMTIELPPRGSGQCEARMLLALPASQRPTAIFVAADAIAKGVYRAAAELGLNIPRDVSVLGFADIEIAAELTPPLTTIRQEAYVIGRSAAKLVVERSTGELRAREPQRLVHPVHLVVRESTQAVPGNRK